MEFGKMLQHMMFVRGISSEVLAKKGYLPREAISMVARGLFMPTPALEHKLRVLLEWPKCSDELIARVYECKYTEETPSPLPLPLGEGVTGVTPTVTTLPAPTTIRPLKPSEILPKTHKKLGRPRKVRPVTENVDDDLLGDDDTQATELRGSVVG